MQGLLVCWILALLAIQPLNLLYAADPALLQLNFDQPLDQIRPQHDRVRVEFVATHADGSPIKAARFHIELSAPRPHPFISTDFPIVEGSQLIDAEILAETGRFVFSWVPPIRGSYRLKLIASPLAGDHSFQEAQREWQPAIDENPIKKRNLAMLLSLLVAIGGLSGLVLGRSEPRRSGHALGRALVVLAALMPTAMLVPNQALAHGTEGHGPHLTTPLPATAVTQGPLGLTVDLRILTPAVRVGELAQLAGGLRDPSGHIIPARFRLRFIQLEHGIEVFAAEIPAPEGKLDWKGQFYDGSLHRVELDAVPLSASFSTTEPVHAELEVAVEAIAPPADALAKSFGLLIIVTAVAMLCGVAIGRRLRRSEV